MTRKELEEKYGDILNDWSEELRIEQDEEMIYYTREQKKELFINLEEQGYTKEELSELDEYTPEKMMEKYEITANQFIDLKGLMGDQSDNIPGVAGIGEKTGIKLLKEYGSIENIYANIGEITKSTKTKLESGYDMAFLSKSLATIMIDIPIELTEEIAKEIILKLEI